MNRYGRQRELAGINIYRDKKGQKVYLDPFSRKAFIITPEKKDRFLALNNVPLYGILTFVFTYVMFELNIYVSLAVSLAVAVVMEWRFRRFLNGCTFYSNTRFLKQHADRVVSSSEDLSILKPLLHLALALVLILSAIFIRTNDSLVYGGSIALAVAFLFAFLKDLSVFISR